MMTIGDYPEYLALGYLLNQNMLKYDDVVTEVEYDDDLQVVVVRTEHHTNFEQKLKKRTQTSGCAQGTAFGDLLEAVESVALPKAELRTSWLYQMTHAINTMPSLYLEAGAIHGCVLCKEGTPVCYTEDVGRHNAVDKIAGWMYPPRRRSRRQDPVHHRPADLRDGDQDGADGNPDPGLALRLYGLGRRSGAAGRVDAGRAHARKTIHRAVRRRSASSTTRTSITSRRNPRGTSARAKRVTTDVATRNSRRTARRRPGAADGRRRQADAPDRRPHHPGARDRAT